jgi:hypothetical protein
VKSACVEVNRCELLCCSSCTAATPITLPTAGHIDPQHSPPACPPQFEFGLAPAGTVFTFDDIVVTEL